MTTWLSGYLAYRPGDIKGLAKRNKTTCQMALKMINKLFDYLQSDAERMSK